ncbi:CdaR family protein [Tenacibaculum maritimum]|uniref:CdaR family protein n=1 Tax=Tenacibaculum maritimum TaxID=107401 RepID=UPI0012E68DCE|nr:YbbR-like domain-containing protein [Tenacibaculum maritimum]CAA0170322.1 conserved hypothetical protein [Tenacibaculum maritimum]CAA0226213.1 conserved hypothetical protein [Tenacibaculum maritimum]
MKRLTKIPKAFIAFLVISIFFWLLTKLSKEYTTTINVPIAYINLPQHKILQKDTPKRINLSIKGSGFKLFTANLENITLKLNAANISKEVKNSYSLSLKKQLNEIKKQLPTGLALQPLENNIIYLSLDSLSSKKVPVEANLKITYEKGYNLSGNIILEPDSIQISGAETAIKNIEKLTLHQLPLKNLSKNTTKNIEIHEAKALKKIKFSHNTVKAYIKVDKFTEGYFEVPFTLKNVPADTEINTFPKLVKVSYTVGLKDFNKVNANSFSIICDYKKTINNNIDYLIPEIENQPKLIKSVKISPKKIEYLIHK